MFEYKFVPMIYDVERNQYTSERELNELGEDGWELVTVMQHGRVEGFDINHNDIQQLPVFVIHDQTAIFKRMI